jgi:hypothetical protein
MKQTAVEWLEQKIDGTINVMPQGNRSLVRKLLIQAKKMEKEQLQLAYASRCSFISCEGNDIEENINCKCGKQYYKETYNR